MRQLLGIIITLALAVGIGVFAVKFFHTSSVPLSQNITQVSASPSFAATTAPQQQTTVVTPVRLRIPKLGIDTTIEQVGLDASGKMDVPSNNTNVAWYKLGYKPGEKGNAVIDGHLDTVTGAPAVFYSLSKLTAGDSVKVDDQNGHTYTFAVVDKQSFDFDKVPLAKIFGPSDTAYLNLITCEGVFNSVTKNYSQRVVVYTKLQQT
ncbi:MAG TPA: class F sortase [Candidatus Saccharimonadales bacterium]|nr:class F sortase [Candidatus Saccharimonadales bacterium]